jgi:hypothetical protein
MGSGPVEVRYEGCSTKYRPGQEEISVTYRLKKENGEWDDISWCEAQEFDRKVEGGDYKITFHKNIYEADLHRRRAQWKGD